MDSRITLTIIASIGVLCCYVASGDHTSPADQRLKDLKILSQECLNTCPAGVDAFEVTYGNLHCRCRALK